MKTDDALVHLARLALAGRPQDIQLFIRRIARQRDFVQIKDSLNSLLRESPNAAAPTRSEGQGAIPVDMDSRLQLVRFEQYPQPEYDPVWSDEVRHILGQVIREREHVEQLLSEGVTPTKSILFTGAPGVGKTLGARWLAAQMGLPLLILDLSAVMSSFLGRTGTNLRMVLDYAKRTRCVLLLDELDAIAKKRDDAAEVGELKRLVTVLLQEIDDWPPTGFMVAATNHPDLLDPAVWRRFEIVVDFPLPDQDRLRHALSMYLRSDNANVAPAYISILAILMSGRSFSDVEKLAMRLRREAILSGKNTEEILQGYILRHVENIPKVERHNAAVQLYKLGVSQRQVSATLKVSRDTLRKLIDEEEKAHGEQ